MYAAFGFIRRAFRRSAFPGIVAGSILAFLALSGPARAEVGVLVLTDDSREVGNITVTPQGYSLARGGEVKNYEKSKVKEFLRATQLRKDLEDKKAKSDLKRPEALLVLAMWANDNGLPEEAEQLANDILKIEPEHANAKRALKWAADLRNSLAGQPAPPPAPQPGAAAPGGKEPAGVEPTTRPATGLIRQPLPLSKEDINKIRIREIWLKDNKPDDVKVSFKNDLLNRFFKSVEGAEGFRTPEDRASFYKQTPARKLQIIVQMSDAEALKKWEKDIDIETDPPPFVAFRNKVYPYVVENCATSTCHGRDNAPGFSWINAASPTPGQYFANFLELEARTYGPAQARLINRDKPGESLLLLYGLPQNQTQYKHPKVDGWPIRTLNDKSPGYLETLRWITKDLSYPPKPDYGVTLQRQGEAPSPAK